MDIPNLSQEPPVLKSFSFSWKIILSLIVLSLVTGFWISRFFPGQSSTSSSSGLSLKTDSPIANEKISGTQDLKVGQLYGNTGKTFKDTVSGTLEKGNINGEGTHILKRPGGDTQRVSLISSSVDLDLFVGRKVEINGETNASKKTGWLLDVGTIKILE